MMPWFQFAILQANIFVAASCIIERADINSFLLGGGWLAVAIWLNFREGK